MQLLPDLANPVAPARGLPHPRDMPSIDHVLPVTRRPPVRVGLAGLVLVVGRRGDRQHLADRLDLALIAMLIDERDHHLRWRSSSAAAK